ncbi:hypothetical protein FJW05_05110 [Mesorhizobium sp. B2-9-1]|uniref:hypothetical protein n=1 Tax=unclassified Mesorhizobium TaxID=325217 RepID=UPI0011271AC4|nr:MULTISPECIES: hypothetical protein [unclassified Mesorhizobium]TPI48740.1 hypothetical protein FJW05_05110 [Mesorhizobium sp. B2-9-1]TPJ31021.1 hypothetical protein FJ425_04680 [Mesorhizobium sp. B2-7-2]TPO01157.1 hypothetical protein FJ980_21980 [Mesorhizobium sp. B1-1-5]
MLRKLSRSALVGAALIAAFALGACRDTGKEQLFAISGKLFEFNYRLAIATYVITLKPLRPMVDGQVAVVSFQNPAGGEPLVVNQKIWPKLPHITLTSPPLSCVVKDKPYKVSIRIQDASGTLLQSIDTTMTSSEDQTMLPDRPLVIGPKYELNPDLAGHPDGRLPDEQKPDCSKAT